MKILVVSDSHGHAKPLLPLIDSYANDIQMVIHLGDYARDLMRVEENYPGLTMVAVLGNSDCYNPFKPDMVVEGEKERILSLEGRRILMLHGDKYHVELNTNYLYDYAKDKDVDVCLFGHTHIQDKFTRGSILFMNPGSLFDPRGGSKMGYGIIEITPESEIIAEVFPL